MKFKRGDIIIAISESYNVTCKTNGWIGKIDAINENLISAKTLKYKYLGRNGHVYDELRQKDFTSLNQAIKGGVKVEF